MPTQLRSERSRPTPQVHRNGEDTRKNGTQYIRDEKRDALRYSIPILVKWARFFNILLNVTGRVDPSNRRMKLMVNVKVVELDRLLAELLKLGLRHDGTIFRKLHQAILL